MDLAIDLFSGIGGVTSGIHQTGLFNIVSVEKSDLKKINRGYEKLHLLNFPNQLFVSNTIQSWKIDYKGLNNNQVKLLHLSPPCQSFSLANRNNRIETFNDLEMAIALTEIIYDLEPEMITIEQVTQYAKSASFEKILSALSNYYVDIHLINLSDYGHPQDRKRLFVTASKKKHLRLPPKSLQYGWGSTFELYDLDALFIHPKGHERRRSRSQPFPAIIRNYFIDTKIRNGKVTLSKRLSTFNYLSKGTLHPVPFKAITRACGFPDDFIFLESEDKLSVCNGAGIGNAFSPKFYRRFLEYNL